MKTIRNRRADESQGSQLLGFDDSLAAVRMARRELAERAWRFEDDADALDARKTSDAPAVSVSHRSRETW
jgi:hypothetical protein